MGTVRIELIHRPDLGEGKMLLKIKRAKPKYRVLLSIHGGGVRVIIPALVLKGFEEAVKKVARELSEEVRAVDDENLVVDIKDCFDAVAGTSAGALLSLYLSSGGGRDDLYKTGGLLEGIRPGSVEGAITLLEKTANKIFPASLWRKLSSRVWQAWGVIRTWYDGKVLESVLDQIFGNKEMGDLEMNTCITAYELNRDLSVVFTCQGDPYSGKKTAGYASLGDEQIYKNHFSLEGVNFPVKVAAQASASPPVYFPPAEYKQDGVYDEALRWIDGGVAVNSPILPGLELMSKIFSPFQGSEEAVLSLGTGSTKNPTNKTFSGAWSWKDRLTTILVTTQTEGSHNFASKYFDSRKCQEGTAVKPYLHIDKVAWPGDKHFDTLNALDSADKLADLKEVGEELKELYQEDMEKFVRQIIMA